MKATKALLRSGVAALLLPGAGAQAQTLRIAVASEPGSMDPRCPDATGRCSEEIPTLREIAPARLSACHLNGQKSLGS